MEKNYVRINPQRFRKWAADQRLCFADISRGIGQTDSYISQCLSRGSIPQRKLELVSRLYGLDIEEVTTVENSVVNTHSDQPYTLSLRVYPDKVRVGVNFNGTELYGAFAGLKGDAEVNLVQAISYAAHMCYKMAEQNHFKNN